MAISRQNLITITPPHTHKPCGKCTHSWEIICGYFFFCLLQFTWPLSHTDINVSNLPKKIVQNRVYSRNSKLFCAIKHLVIHIYTAIYVTICSSFSIEGNQIEGNPFQMQIEHLFSYNIYPETLAVNEKQTCTQENKSTGKMQQCVAFDTKINA